MQQIHLVTDDWDCVLLIELQWFFLSFMRFDHAHLVKVEKANVVTCLFDCVIFCIHGIYDYEKSIFNLQ